MKEKTIIALLSIATIIVWTVAAYFFYLVAKPFYYGLIANALHSLDYYEFWKLGMIGVIVVAIFFGIWISLELGGIRRAIKGK